jgi:hypothetical protein
MSSKTVTPSSTSPASEHPQAIEGAGSKNQQQHRPEIEALRRDVEHQAQQTLNQEAIAIIEETRKAINAIDANKTDEAIKSIEQATAKADILLARDASEALIPVRVEVDVIDTAPQDRQSILELAQDASRAMDEKDLPTARVLLQALISEIRVRTYNLPTATYPTALRQAAGLLNQNASTQAGAALQTALNTLVVIDQVTPLPMMIARAAISEAEAQRAKDKDAALRLLEVARIQLERSRELGYWGKDLVYATLSDEIEHLEKQLKGSGDTTAVFSKLKEKLAAFLKRKANHEPSGSRR